MIPKFQHGDRVCKVKGSSWHGHIVGTYSTPLTPEGYCVESEREPGSVQLYPASALELLQAADDIDMATPDRLRARPHVAPPASGSSSGRANISDPIERIVAEALTAAGIRWTAGNNQQRLDFHLPDLGIKIECKQFPTPRTAAQIADEPNVIVVQGRAAAKWFASLLGAFLSGRRSMQEEAAKVAEDSKAEFHGVDGWAAVAIKRIAEAIRALNPETKP